MTLAWIPLTAACFALTVVAHALACRLELGADRVVRFLAVGIPIGVVGVALAWHLFGLSIETVAAALVYAFLSEAYVFVFTMTISSISANVLLRLRSRAVDIQELDTLYNDEWMVEQRVSRLIATGFLTAKEDRLALTSKGRQLLTLFLYLRRAFCHDQGS